MSWPGSTRFTCTRGCTTRVSSTQVSFSRIILLDQATNARIVQRAPTAIKEVKKFAQKTMGTKKVVVDVGLNNAIWGRGVKSVPHRIRVRLHRKRNDDEDAKADEKLFTLATYVPTKEFKGLQTTGQYYLFSLPEITD